MLSLEKLNTSAGTPGYGPITRRGRKMVTRSGEARVPGNRGGAWACRRPGTDKGVRSEFASQGNGGIVRAGRIAVMA